MVKDGSIPNSEILIQPSLSLENDKMDVSSMMAKMNQVQVITGIYKRSLRIVILVYKQLSLYFMLYFTIC